MKRLMMFLLTLAMVCTMGVISFAEGNIAPHDLSPEPIIPDVCSHLYSFKYATSISETDPKTVEHIRLLRSIMSAQIAVQNIL